MQNDMGEDMNVFWPAILIIFGGLMTGGAGIALAHGINTDSKMFVLVGILFWGIGITSVILAFSRRELQ